MYVNFLQIDIIIISMVLIYYHLLYQWVYGPLISY